MLRYLLYFNQWLQFFTMFDIFFIVSLFFFCIFCFFELIVFNEEILLALCFFSFIFFSFNSLGDSIFETFQSRSAKFEEDLLVSFSSTKNNLESKFSSFILSRNFVSKIQILSICVDNFLSVLTRYYSFKWFSLFFSSCVAKLSELSSFENKLIQSYQEASISLLLYPLIFQSSKNSVALIASVTKTKVSTNKTQKVTLLRSVCN